MDKGFTIDKKMKILIVDDMPNMRRTIRNMLHSIEFVNIVEADDGDTALQKIESGTIRFVVCDWNMPRLPGIELLRAVREKKQFHDLPFLMITAENWQEEIAEAAEELVDGYIIKPFVAATLEKKISEILQSKKNPSEAEAIFRESEQAVRDEKYEEALGHIEKVLEMAPHSAKAHFEKGLIYFHQKDLEKSEEWLKKALQLNNKVVTIYTILADIYLMQKKVDNAIDILQKGLKISPRNSERQNLLGRIYLEKKMYKEIEDLMVKSLRANMEFRNSEGQFILAKSYVGRKEYTKAVQALKQSMEMASVLTKNKLLHDIKDFLASDETVKEKMEPFQKILESIDRELAKK